MPARPSPRRFPPHTVPSLGELSEVREDFTTWVGALTASEERVEDLAVVVSELGANAVHGTPGEDPATVTAWVDGSELTLEVANRVDPGDDADVHWDLEDGLRSGGRGLLLVSAFVDDVEVDVEDDILLVRCTTAL